MTKRAKLLDWSATVGTAVIVVFAFVVARDYVKYKAETASVLQGPAPGSAVAFPDMDWPANHTTLIIAMQVGCHWCEASANFYKDLIRSDSMDAFHPVAVLPEPFAESRKFLHGLGLEIPDVRQLDLDNIGVHSTPTLILVDAQGKVEASWVGKLTPKWERSVFRKIGIQWRPSNSDHALETGK